jgi:carbonic anhydrase
MQSPIALETANAATHVASASTSYHHMSSVVLTDIGWTVSASAQPGGVMDLDGRQYVLEEIHAHAPAEHTIDDHRADLEAHLVHRNAEGQLAVLAVLFDATPDKQPIDAFIAPPGGSPSIERLDLIVPSGSTTFRYVGSRTTPPYATGVRWNVFTKRLEVGEAALATFIDLYGPNIRELQDSSEVTPTLG